MGERRTMVTLVHGTWARNAPWTLEGSRMWRALEEQGYEVDRADWGGGNRFSSRRDAAATLRAQLQGQQGFDRFVVAHSHGGNIALRALNGDDGVAAGVVCLNTPFLTVLRRNQKTFDNILMHTLVPTSLIALGLGLRDGFRWSLLLIYLAAIVAAVAGSALLVLLRGLLEKRTARYRIEPLEQTPLLCVNSPDDEAFGSLAFVTATQSLVFLAISRPVMNNRAFAAPIGFLVLFEFLPHLYVPWELWAAEPLYTRALVSSLELTASGSPGPWTTLGVAAKFFAIYLLSACNYVMIYVLAALLLLIVCALVISLTQGYFAPLSALFHRFMVTLTPLQSRHVTFLEHLGDGVSAQHSALYDDPATIATIVEWIERTRAQRPPAVAPPVRGPVGVHVAGTHPH